MSDYGKLRTVALCSGASSECDDPQNGWNVTKNGVTKLEQVLELGLERELFTTLVPVKYPLALGLEPVSKGHSSTALNDAAEWCKPSPPFEHTTGVYLWTTVDRDYWLKDSGFAPNDWAFTPVVLTSGDPGFAKTWHAASWTVFGRMFDALDPGGDLSKGGLGINEQEFMAASYGLKGDRYSLGEHFQPYQWTSLSSCSNESWPWG